MGKKKKGKNKTIVNIPAVGLQTAHFKAKSRLRQRPVQPQPHTEIQLVQETAHHPCPDRRAPPAMGRIGGGGRTGVMPLLPPGVQCKMSGFTAKNYSTCRPCGLPQIPGICPMCEEYYFDVTPHIWSFHELDLAIAQQMATAVSA